MGVRWLPFVLGLLIAAPALAQTRDERNCQDDRGVDRCAAEQQQHTRALFGVRSIEDHRDAGDQVRRVFYVDGYGRDVVTISFVRARGREPTAYVHFPRREGQQALPPLEAPVPSGLWAEMLQQSPRFDRNFAPEPPPPSDVITLCLHSWVYTIEANDPVQSNGTVALLRRKTEDACEDGPGELFATELQRVTLPLFPYCNRLDPELHRNPASQLGACSILAGDRMAAAEVMNRLDDFRRARGPQDASELAGIFVHGAPIDWHGRRSSPGDPSPESFWLTRLAEDGVPSFFYARIEGLSADRVRVTGTLERAIDGPEGAEPTFHRAPVEMVWKLTSIREFQIESATVGPWETYRPD